MIALSRANQVLKKVCIILLISSGTIQAYRCVQVREPFTEYSNSDWCNTINQVMDELYEQYKTQYYCSSKIIIDAIKRGLLSDVQKETLWEWSHREALLNYLVVAAYEDSGLHVESKDEFMYLTLMGKEFQHKEDCTIVGLPGCIEIVDYLDAQSQEWDIECPTDLELETAVNNIVSIHKAFIDTLLANQPYRWNSERRDIFENYKGNECNNFD